MFLVQAGRKLSCKKPQNIVRHGGQVTSERCVEAVQNARLSLNLMPWFKDGAHDRIFTAMLQQTVALTDDSRYLRGAVCGRQGAEIFFLKGSSSVSRKLRLRCCVIHRYWRKWQCAEGKRRLHHIHGSSVLWRWRENYKLY